MAAYEVPNRGIWNGRNDGDQINQLRWWQHIHLCPMDGDFPDFKQAPVIVGFACDEGVARNKGRVGSAEAPSVLRKMLSDLPVHNPKVGLHDVGTIRCVNHRMEAAQDQLAEAVQEILKCNGFPILLGGGHEILFGHYKGVSRHLEGKKVGVINFDAHFDIRKPESNGASSGTGFYQLAPYAKSEDDELLYLAIGIQRSGNTAELFNRAHDLKVEYTLAQDFHPLNLEAIKKQIQRFVDKTDAVCLTIDLDVFSTGTAPGVSAPSATGILYDYTFREVFKLLATCNKVVSLDIAELNPTYDIDSHTAKLAAQLLFNWVDWRFE